MQNNDCSDISRIYLVKPVREDVIPIYTEITTVESQSGYSSLNVGTFELRVSMVSSQFVGTEVVSLAELGMAVRRSRKAQKLRIDDAAGLCGVSTDVLSRLENGIPITTSRLLLILKGLGMQLAVADPMGAAGD